MDKKIENNISSNETESLLLLSEVMRRLLTDFRHQMLMDMRMLLHDTSNPTNKQWIKSAEVKKLLAVSHGTLQNLRNKGIIPYTRIGGVIYYSHKEIEKMLEHHKKSTS